MARSSEAAIRPTSSRPATPEVRVRSPSASPSGPGRRVLDVGLGHGRRLVLQRLLVGDQRVVQSVVLLDGVGQLRGGQRCGRGGAGAAVEGQVGVPVLLRLGDDRAAAAPLGQVRGQHGQRVGDGLLVGGHRIGDAVLEARVELQGGVVAAERLDVLRERAGGRLHREGLPLRRRTVLVDAVHSHDGHPAHDEAAQCRHQRDGTDLGPQRTVVEQLHG
jgi:hypothetical protein